LYSLTGTTITYISVDIYDLENFLSTTIPLSVVFHQTIRVKVCAMVRQNPIDRDAELEPATAPDRRRSGRRDDVSPTLIPLLRGDFSAQLNGHLIDEEADQLRSAKGVIIWVLISAASLTLLLWWVV
jgi:hypothetical protein